MSEFNSFINIEWQSAFYKILKDRKILKCLSLLVVEHLLGAYHVPGKVLSVYVHCITSSVLQPWPSFCRLGPGEVLPRIIQMASAWGLGWDLYWGLLDFKSVLNLYCMLPLLRENPSAKHLCICMMVDSKGLWKYPSHKDLPDAWGPNLKWFGSLYYAYSLGFIEYFVYPLKPRVVTVSVYLQSDDGLIYETPKKYPHVGKLNICSLKTWKSTYTFTYKGSHDFI